MKTDKLLTVRVWKYKMNVVFGEFNEKGLIHIKISDV